ncbi:MAG: DUF4372 domain-containing protein, partial [Holosporales bacterium]
MKPGKMIFAQVMEHLPHHVFQESVKRYAGRHLPLSFSHWDQFLCMAFAQLVGVE